MDQQTHSARRAFKYNGTFLDRGRALTLAGCENDDKLCRLGFFSEIKGNPILYPCGICGAPFISDRQRTAHGNRAHEGVRDPRRDAPQMTTAQGKAEVNRIMNDPGYEPALVPDETISTQDKENEREAPVFMEKTEASILGGYGVTDITPPAPSTPIPRGPGPCPAPQQPAPKQLTGVDLLAWRTSQKLTRPEAAAILGIGRDSIKRAEGLKDHPLGSKLAPALKKALGH